MKLLSLPPIGRYFMGKEFEVVRDRWLDYLEQHTLRLENDAYRVKITYASGNDYHEDFNNRKLNLERTFSLVDIKKGGYFPFHLVYGNPYMELPPLVVPFKDIPEFTSQVKQTEEQLAEFKKKFDELFPPDRCLPVDMEKIMEDIRREKDQAE